MSTTVHIASMSSNGGTDKERSQSLTFEKVTKKKRAYHNFDFSNVISFLSVR